MKKNNGKFRNNNTNAFNLNYRFDSISPAGKCSGTALDLIKRYNDLSKEAHSAGDYVEMEVFRQYAEHYRKILTEMNERKNAFQAQRQAQVENNAEQETTDNQENQENPENTSAENETEESSKAIEQKPLPMKKKTLKIVEVTKAETLPQKEPESSEESKPKRVYKKRVKEVETEKESAAV